MQSRRFLTASANLSRWRLIIMLVATAFVRDAAPQGTSLALAWSTKLVDGGRGSLFVQYGDPNSYRDQMERNETLSGTSLTFWLTETSSFKYIALEADTAHARLYYSGWDDYLTYANANISITSNNAFRLAVPAVSNLVTGLSVDWVSNLIYWSDAIYQRICILETKYHFFWRPVVESRLSSPQDVAIYPQHGFLFWTDSSPKIERLDLANNIRQVLVTNDSLLRPTTLVIDFVTQRLLWLDSAASRIGIVNFDGSGLSFWSMDLISSISSFVIFKDYFFLGDKTQPKAYAYNFTEKSFVGCVMAEDTSGVIDITAYAPEKQPSFASPCSLNNGGCDHFCITKSTTERVCQCGMGSFLESNGAACSPALLEDNFLLVSDRYQFNIFQVDIWNGEVRAVSAKTSDLFAITAMDYDPVTRTVYAFDNIYYSIKKVALADHTISTILHSQGKEIGSLAVDPVGRLLYYVNHDSGAIMRSSLSGDDPRTIVSGYGILATALALDVLNRLMFWSDCSVDRYTIEKAPLSNPDSHQSVVTISGVCARSIAVDYSSQLIFWADDTGRIEQVGYNRAGRLLIRQMSSTSSIKGLAVDSDVLYISDSKQKQIQRLNRSSYELSNLTGIRFSRPYAITLFRSAIWETIANASSTTTPTSAEDSSTTVILAAVICSSVVFIAGTVTLGVIFGRRYKKKRAERTRATIKPEETEMRDNHGYETLVASGLTSAAQRVELASDLTGNVYASSSPRQATDSKHSQLCAPISKNDKCTSLYNPDYDEIIETTSKNDKCISIYNPDYDEIIEPPLPTPRTGEIIP